MQNRAMTTLVAAIVAMLLPVGASAQITAYSQDFEGLNQADNAALSSDGWLVYGAVFDITGSTFLYDYASVAPNGPTNAFSAIVNGQGGVDQGAQQLSIFSDYENVDHGNNRLIQSNVYQEFTITNANVGQTWDFVFESKLGNLGAPSTALAYISTIDPNDSFAQTNFVSVDQTATPTTWTGYTLSLTIDSGLVGQIFQVGFRCEATAYDGSGIFYDNVSLEVQGGGVDVGIIPYFQDFEGLNPADTAALGNDGWQVFGTVFEADGTTFIYGYGPFPAPNTGAAFSAIDTGQGGVDQGLNQLSIYNDYENTDHNTTRRILSTTYREYTVDASDVGQTWEFFFEAKAGNLVAPSTAQAFIKTIDPMTGFSQTNLVAVDMTSAPATWTGYTLQLYIDAGLVGQLFQVGFECTASQFAPSGVFYDNVDLRLLPAGTSAPVVANASGKLAQNFPNPFRADASTSIQFSLDRESTVDVSVFDVAGRRVSTLKNGTLAAGDHTVRWNGTNAAGATVASGQYFYVLRTEEGSETRRMVLLK